jgi:hypothetical protein
MAIPTLIYCAGGNRRFAEIAITAGFKYGAQLPDTIYFDPYFVDQNWKKPNRAAYMDCLKKYHPTMASVMDWERPEQLAEVLEWAEEAAQFIDVVMIIPKVHGGVEKLPRMIGGKRVILGFSVPTKFGGTDLFLSEFIGWPVHLLGGNPGKQMKLAQYMNVASVDGNMHNKLALRYCFFWKGLGKNYSNVWTDITSEDGERWATDAPYEAFRRSCENIMAAWEKIYS